MKLLRYGPPGYEKPGLLDANGAIRDLSGVVDQVDERASVATRAWRSWRKSSPRRCRWSRQAAARRAVPRHQQVHRHRAELRDHAAESGVPVPSEPILFMKATTCINGPNDAIVHPARLDQNRLGSRTRRRHRHHGAVRDAGAKALDHVAGYCVVNDVSERNFQLERGSQWDRGKGCDTFGPIGPYLVTTDEMPDPQTLDMWLDVNGEPMQRGNTRTMVFGCRAPGQLRQPVHDAAAGRHHHDRHAARRRHGHEAAAVPEARRRRHARHAGLGEQRQHVRAHA